MLGNYFAILPVFYMLAGVLMQYYPKWMDNRVYLIGIGYLNTIAALFNGPSQILSLPDSIWCIIVGQMLIGLTCAQLNVFALPEMMRQANKAFPGRGNDVNDYCSGIFNSCIGIGQVSGPIIGAFLTSKIGFRSCEDTIALITFTYYSLYFILGDGREAINHSIAKRAALPAVQKVEESELE